MENASRFFRAAAHLGHGPAFLLQTAQEMH